MTINKQIMKKNIPNFITIINLAAGFGAIAALFSGYIVAAAWLIIIAMLFDFLDGLAARLLNAISETGKHLDSLADIVSFSVAPGLILYFLKLNAQTGVPWSSIPLQGSVPALQTLLFPLLIPIFGAIRLARFNTSGSSDSFMGLPVPAAALAIIAPVISATYASKTGVATLIVSSPVLLSLLALVIGVLMVSPVKMLSLKVTTVNLRDNLFRYILLLSVITALVIWGVGSLVLVIPLYIAVSVTASLFS